jgi:hypothetical protein
MESYSRLQRDGWFALLLQDSRAFQNINELVPWVIVFASAGSRWYLRHVYGYFFSRHPRHICFEKRGMRHRRLLGAQDLAPDHAYHDAHCRSQDEYNGRLLYRCLLPWHNRSP